MAGIPQSTPDALCWLLVVEGARTYRWVSEDVDVTQAGSRVAAAWALEADALVESLGATPSASVIAFGVPDEVGSRGAPDLETFLGALTVAWCELSICPVTDGVARMEDRVVLRAGRVEDVEFSPQSLAVSVSLIGNELDDAGDLCPAAATIEEVTFPLHNEDVRGRAYPWVYGTPGAYKYQSATDTAAVATITYTNKTWPTGLSLVVAEINRTSGATPAMPIDIEVDSIEIAPGVAIPDVLPRYLLIDSEWASSDVTAVTLWVQFEDHANGWITSTDGALVRGFDGLGRPVTLLDTSTLDRSYRRGGKFFVGWTSGAPRSGNMGDLVVEVLQRATCQIDWTSIRTAAAYLRRYTLGGYVDKSVTPTAWVVDRARQLGCVARWGVDGFGLAVIDPGWTQAPVAALEVGAGVEVSGPLRMRPGTLDTVEVAWTGQGASETAGRRVRSVVRRVEDGSARGPGLAGERRRAVTAAEVWDAATAIRMGELEHRLAGPFREIRVMASIWWVRPGDDVLFTWADLGVDAETWRVIEVEQTTAMPRALLLRRYDPLRLAGTATIESSTLEG